MDSAQFHKFTAALLHTLSADDRVRALVGIGSLATCEDGRLPARDVKSAPARSVKARRVIAKIAARFILARS